MNAKVDKYLDGLDKAYIYEAIEIQRAGLKVPMKKTSDYPVPPEFQKRLAKNAKLRKAFEGLTPGKGLHEDYRS